MRWPTTAAEAGTWLLMLAAGYVVVACLVAARRRRLHSEFAARLTYDSITFSLSAMLLFGIIHPAIFELIGGITIPALAAGMSGVLYSLRALFTDVEHNGKAESEAVATSP